MSNRVFVKVSATFACFTRPEAKVERVSYLCMTPSAARGVLESILWKPEFVWIVHNITVLKPVQFASVRRNEIQDTIPVRGDSGVLAWMKERSAYRPYYTDSAGRKSPYGENRVQRHTLALNDVAYIISAEPKLTNKAYEPRVKSPDADEAHGPNTTEKYVCMFERRVNKGQCFQQPYLGLREFVADFEPAQETDTPDGNDAVLGSQVYPLGRMFFDFDYKTDGARVPLFAPAVLSKGLLDVDEMRRNATAQPQGEEL